MDKSVTLDLVNASITSAKTGPTERYFTEAAYQQGPLRQRFSELRAGIVDLGPPWHDYAVDILTEVNGIYGTRLNRSMLPIIADATIVALHHEGWIDDNPPHLLTASDETTSKIAATYIATLVSVANQGAHRPFSLISKWLHLLFPDTFVIYDKNAAASVKAWSAMALSELDPRILPRLQFDVDNRHWVTHWDNPNWYAGLLTFYRDCWVVAGEHGLHAELATLARGLQTKLENKAIVQDTKITVLDVIDCHLWKCNGNSSRLGIAGGSS